MVKWTRYGTTKSTAMAATTAAATAASTGTAAYAVVSVSRTANRPAVAVQPTVYDRLLGSDFQSSQATAPYQQTHHDYFCVTRPTNTGWNRRHAIIGATKHARPRQRT